MATYNGYTTDQLRAFVNQYFSNPNSADIQYLRSQGLIPNTNPDTLLYFGLTNMLGFSPSQAQAAVSDVFSASSATEPGTEEPPADQGGGYTEPPAPPPPPPPVYTASDGRTFGSEAERNAYEVTLKAPTIQEVINKVTQPVAPKLESWQKLDANGNIVNKTMADYTFTEMIPFAQNLIAQQQAAGKYITPDEFRVFAGQQGVPDSQMAALVASLNFPKAPAVQQPAVNQPVNNTKPLSAYTSAEMIPYIQNLFKDNPNVSAQMIRQYAMSQNVPASVIDAALGGVQIPTANFVPFTVGGGTTSLKAPTTDFFYGAGPTQQAPFMFKSGAAGYTRLLPQSLEFGVPAVTGTKPEFKPGVFDKDALQKSYESQTKETYGGEPFQGGMWNGGKVTKDKIAYEKGGKVKGLLGPNPSNPDDGYGSLQVGEYVIRKKAVNKYGEDFLKALNESRLPKDKVKSLL